MNKAKLALTLGTLIVLSMEWAAPLLGAAHSYAPKRTLNQVPSPSTSALLPIRMREDRSAGLLVNGWINDAGPFTFAIDTGAGVSIVSSHVVATAGLHVTKSSRQLVGGLSTSRIASNEEVVANKLSLGSKSNEVPGRPRLAVVATLPGLIDGILDPGDLFGPLAYSIDLPNHQLLVFDPAINGLNLTRPPAGGAIVRWVKEAGSDRPFVKLGDGRLALIDTGSGFGLAVNTTSGEAGRNHRGRQAGDLGGGAVQSREVEPTTISVGDLVLRGVPTDLLIGVAPGTPIILGRRALFPFKVTFVRASRLIVFEPTLRNDQR